jgi:hypothetical protein
MMVEMQKAWREYSGSHWEWLLVSQCAATDAGVSFQVLTLYHRRARLEFLANMSHIQAA